ncbi:MAG: glycosyltransferase family 4 protein [Pyrinomonadaceae bacterium]
MKIIHIIGDLDIGGAQTMLHQLLCHTDRSGFESEVVSLTDTGAISDRIKALGVPVRALGMRRGGAPEPAGLLRLARWLRRSRPDVVQTWLYHADMIGGLAARGAGIRAVAWGIHITHLDAQTVKRRTLWTAKVCARLSHYVPRRIVCCAEASQRLHAEMGYATEKMTVIPNGFDLNSFKPDTAARASIRRELGIPDEAPLIGLIGRFHPQKDYQNFVRAAALLHARLPEARFLLCGEGVDSQNQALVAWVEEVAPRDKFHLIGSRRDMPRLYNALDILSLSSAYGEAFPMVVGEAMACGIPCVVTDIGDSALIVGDAGRVVPARDSQALAAAWLELLAMETEARRELGRAARKRIEKQYSITSIAARYEDLYKEIGRG